MTQEDLDKFRNDPRLAESAAKAGCSTEEFLNRICRNAGIRIKKQSKK